MVAVIVPLSAIVWEGTSIKMLVLSTDKCYIHFFLDKEKACWRHSGTNGIKGEGH